MSESPRDGLPGLLVPDAVLTRSAQRLAARWEGVVSAQTVERLVFESYAALLRTCRVKTHLPVLAGRFAEDRLTALAQSLGAAPKDRPEVLFLCVQNAGRSQLAAALVEELSGGRVHARSAGSAPATQVEPLVRAELEDMGRADAAYPKPLTDDVVRAADVVVTMGCGDACPVYPGKRYLDWDVADPAGQDESGVRAVRADVEARVRALLADLDVSAEGEVGQR